jgi:peptidyl-prolyl cis-trans isomerase C
MDNFFMRNRTVLALTLIAALAGANSLATAQSGSATTAQAAPAAAAAPVAVTPESVIISGPAGTITVADVEKMVELVVPPGELIKFWGNPDAANRFVQSMYDQQALAQQAIAEKLDRTPEAILKLKLTREQLLATLLVNQRVKESMPDDNAVKTYAQTEIKANPKRFETPEEVSVRHILIKVAADGKDDAQSKAKAQGLLDQIRKGANFEQLAKDNSEDPGSATKGGDLGYFARGRMVPEFDQAAFDLKKPGDLSDLVKSKFGYHILQFIGRKPQGLKPMPEIMEQLRGQLVNTRTTQARQDLIGKIESASQINTANIDALKQQQASRVQHPSAAASK